MTGPRPFSAAKRARVQRNINALAAKNVSDEEIEAYVIEEESLPDDELNVHERNAYEQQSISSTADVYKQKLKTAPPEQKAALENRIRNIEKGAQVGTATQQAGNAAVLGTLQGAVAPLDLVLGAVNLPLKAADAVLGTELFSEPIKKARGKLAERNAEVEEALGDNRTKTSQGIQFAGNIAGGAAGFSGLSSMLASGLMSAAIRSGVGATSRVMKLFQAANATAKAGAGAKEIAGVAAKRALATSAVGAPLNALQAVSLEDASFGDRLKTFAIGFGADLVGGAARGTLGRTPKAPKVAPAAPPDPAMSKLQEVNRRIRADAEKQINIERNRQLAGAREEAELAWKLANPYEDYSKLTPTEQRAIVHAHKERIITNTRRRVQDLYSGKAPDATVDAVLRWPGVGAIMHNLGDAITKEDLPGVARATAQLDAALQGVPDDVVSRIMLDVSAQVDAMNAQVRARTQMPSSGTRAAMPLKDWATELYQKLPSDYKLEERFYSIDRFKQFFETLAPEQQETYVKTLQRIVGVTDADRPRTGTALVPVPKDPEILFQPRLAFGARATEQKALPPGSPQFPEAPSSTLYTADPETNPEITSKLSVLRHGPDAQKPREIPGLGEDEFKPVWTQPATKWSNAQSTAVPAETHPEVTPYKVRERRLRDVEPEVPLTDAQIQARLLRAKEGGELERAKKRGGIVAETAPEIAGGLLGLVVSSSTIQDDDSDTARAIKNTLGVVVGGALGHAARRPTFDPVPRVRTLSEQEVEKTIKMRSEFLEMQKGDKDLPFYYRFLRRFSGAFSKYTGYVRPAEIIGSVHSMAAGRNSGVDASNNVMFEAALAMKPVMASFPWLDGEGAPVVVLPDGTLHTFEGVKNITQIIKEANGDIKGLDIYAKSESILERHARGRVTLTPDQVMHYENARTTASPEVRAAAKSLRELNLALVETLKMHGVISEKAYARMQGDPFYTPLNILFDDALTAGTVFGKPKQTTVGGQNPVKRLKGSTGDVIHQSPLERTMEMIPQTMAAVHVAEMQNKFLGAVLSMGEAGNWLARPEGKVTADPLLQRVIDDYTANGHMDVDEVKRFYALARGGTLDESSPVMLRYNNGTLERWRVNPEVAHAFKGLNPFEMMVAAESLGQWAINNGFTRGTADALRFGIAAVDPMFRFISAFKNEIQTAINSEVPYVPGEGVSGALKIARHDPIFKEAMAYGAVGGRHTMAYEKTPGDMLRHANRIGGGIGLPGESKFDPRVIGDLYNAKMEPISDATAMQLYYKARGLGWAPQKAAFYTVEAQGNVQQLGHDARVLARVGVFWRAIVGGTDRFVYSSGFHPFRSYGADKTAGQRRVAFLAKGFGMLSVPAIGYWFATQDDAELNEARRSAWGRQRIVIRYNKEIIGLPLPELESIFWSGAMDVMDRIAGKESQIKEIGKQWLMNAMPDLIPHGYATLGAVVSGTDLRTRRQVVPLEVSGNSPEMQYTDKTTLFATRLGQAANVSPAMVDYLVRQLGGTAAAEMFEAYDVSERWVTEKWPPAKDEIPFLRRFIRELPDTRTEFVERFYDNFGELDVVMRDYNKRVNEEIITKEWMEEHEVQLMRGAIYYNAKRALTDLRKAMRLVEQHKTLSRRVKEEQKTALTEMFLKTVREVAEMDEKIATKYEAR